MRILYPMFVYCHLELVNRDVGAVAREFHRRYASDHELLHAEEVRALRGLASPSHAAADPVAKPPRVTSASHQLEAHEPGVSRPVLEHVASNTCNPYRQVGVQASPGARLAVQPPTPPPR